MSNLIGGGRQGIIPAIVENPWLLLAFVSLFHIIGAAVLASALRTFWRGLHEGEVHGCQVVFTTIWAAMFGGIPFIFGLEFARSDSGTPLFVLAQIVVWGSTFLAVLLAEDILKETIQSFLNREMILMLFGSPFLLAGLAMIAFARGEGELGTRLTGGIFVLIGGVTFLLGLSRLLRATR
jgi:hypothetical protein